MPTGYTENIPNGISFIDFALNCSAAFVGSFILEDLFEASDRCLRLKKEKESELEKLLSMTNEEIEVIINKEWEEDEAARIAYIESNDKLFKAYNSMLEKVNNWSPPTEEHAKLKSFMQEQIGISIRTDCLLNEELSTPTTKMTVDTWFNKEVSALKSCIAYYESRHRQELKKANEKILWRKEINNSIQEQGLSS